MATIEAGKTYTVNHCRKGRMTVLVTNPVNDEWVHGIFMAGSYKVMNPDNAKEHGEQITVRKSFLSDIKEVA